MGTNSNTPGRNVQIAVLGGQPDCLFLVVEIYPEVNAVHTMRLMLPNAVNDSSRAKLTLQDANPSAILTTISAFE